MKTGEFAELVLLRVNGGELGGDSAVQFADVNAYIPVAINEAVRQYVLSGVTLDANSPIFSTKTYTPTLYKDKIYKIEVASPHSWSGAINEVHDESYDTLFPAASMSALVSNDKMGFKSYFAAGSVGGKTTLYMVCPTGQVTVKGAFTLDIECDGDLDIQAPREVEASAIEIAVAHFKDQRGIPQVPTPGATDVNAQTAPA